ncbi:MAG: translation initiation factor IF-2 N-terminal domain-containing protein [Syntrophomonadaceae bacterium]
MGIYSAIRQRIQVKNSLDELNITIRQAETIRTDLVQIMEDALDLSRSIVNDLDAKMGAIAHTGVPDNSPGDTADKQYTMINPEIENNVVDLPMAGNNRVIRVYELAREMGLTSKVIIDKLREAGYDIKSHMSKLTGDQVEIIREQLGSGVKTGDDYASNIDDVQVTEPQLENQLQSAEYQSFVNNLKKAHPYLAVRTLYEKGFSIREMAQLLERGQGEIELLLNLARKKQVL